MEEAPLKSLVRVLLEVRKALLKLLGTLFVLSVAFLFLASRVLVWVQGRFEQSLAFFSVTEPWMALIKTSAILAFLLAFPYLVWTVGRPVSRFFRLKTGVSFVFFLASILLFYSGVLFCFFVTLPYGIKFLLAFQKEEVVPTISVNHFVNFVGIFVTGFGVLFELPLLIVLASLTGLVDPYKLGRYRRHAIFTIALVSAIVTPTPDVFNMSLMAIPLYLLFELGIAAGKLAARKKT